MLPMGIVRSVVHLMRLDRGIAALQQKLQTTIVLASLGIATVLLLLVIAVVTGSPIPGLIAGIVGAFLLAVVCVAGIRMGRRVSTLLSQLSARVKSLEARATEQERVLDRQFDQNKGEDSGSSVAYSQVPAAQTTIEESLESIGNRVTSFEKKKDDTTEQLLGIRKQLKVLRNRVPAGYLQPVQDEIHELRQSALALLRTSFESAFQLKRDPKTLLSTRQAEALFQEYLLVDEILQLRPLIENFDLLEQQSLSTLRRLYRFYKNSGYWDLAALTIDQVREKSGLETDAHVAAKLKHEIEVFAHPDRLTVELGDKPSYDPTGPVLHMVGRVLPETQTGYTLRTQYTALAQARKGLPVAVVGQSGIADRDLDAVEHYALQDIDYYLLPGPARNQVLLGDWLRRNMEELALLVREIRPSILHAQSDFFNALIVNAVGKKYGIPTVYESRGFWEYSWLSRTISANKWHDPENLFATYGLPSAYEYRKHAEEVVRLLPDHVFTLAEVMREHILKS